MKLLLAVTIISSSMALVACGGGFKANLSDATRIQILANPEVPSGLDSIDSEDTQGSAHSTDDIPEGVVNVGPVEKLDLDHDIASLVLRAKGDLEGSFNINKAEQGDTVECLNSPEGIKITASSKEFFESKFSLQIKAGTDIPAKLKVGGKDAVAEMSFTVSPDEGTFIANSDLEKCLVSVAMSERTTILTTKINCVMIDESLKLKTEVKAVIQCNLSGSQLSAETSADEKLAEQSAATKDSESNKN